MYKDAVDIKSREFRTDDVNWPDRRDRWAKNVTESWKLRYPQAAVQEQLTVRSYATLTVKDSGIEYIFFDLVLEMPLSNLRYY